MNDILLIEDHIELAQLIQAFLKKEGFSLYHAKSGEEAMSWYREHQTRVIILDIMLPGIDGFAFCKWIRTISEVPVLILSARSAKEDQLLGFKLGADDYIQKPVDPDILCAKLHALMHRHTLAQQHNRIIQSGALCVDVDARKVTLSKEAIELNAKEFDLLMLFITNPGKTLHKEYLFHQIWGELSSSENQTLTVHIKMLRSKIEDHPKDPQRIQTVWGVGYRYEAV